ncbi:hypothetical protein BJ741DRAFT_612762 [Chytriomyces cf. hyalinus JEL632]|nr:hypothetical protein BJ741DRAFT_612762 [Chytriomyces cf. hyalinus JEL632]
MPRHPTQRNTRPNPIQTQQQQIQQQQQQQQQPPPQLRRGDAEIPGDLDLFFLELEAMFNARADGERSQPLHVRAVEAMREELLRTTPTTTSMPAHRRRAAAAAAGKAGSVTSERSEGTTRDSVSPVKRDHRFGSHERVTASVSGSGSSSSERMMRQNAARDVCLHVPEVVDGADVDTDSHARALTMSSTDCLPLTWDDVFGGGSNSALVDMFGHWDAGLLDNGSEAFVTPVPENRREPETAETPAVPADDIV